MAGEDSASLVATGISFALAIISVVMRFYVRVRTKAGLAWDDWWILIGLIMALLTGSLLMWGIKLDPTAAKAISDAVHENRTSSFDTTPHTTYIKAFFVSSVLYFSIITPIKLSILLLYRRIFAINKAFRLQSLLLVVVVLVYWVVATLGTLLNCRPFKYRWTGLLPEQYCFNLNIFWMIMGAIEVVIDTVILALPVRMVLGLNLSRKRKISLVLIFLLGGFVIITGILRVVYGYVPGKRILFDSGADLWSTVHIGMAIVCACLPTIRPVLAQASSLVNASSSTMRRYYSSWKGHSSKGSSDYDRSITSKTEVMIESRPIALKHLELQSSRSLTEPDAQAIEVIHREYQNHYPSTKLEHPHIKSVWTRDGQV